MAYLTASERRTAIVQAAARVIIRDGLAAATTRRIADEAGVNLAALHYSFDGKVEIYTAVDDMFRATAVGSSLESTTGGTREEIIRSLLQRFQDLLRTDRGVPIAQYELLLWTLRNPDKAELAAASYSTYISTFAEELRHATDIDGSDITLLARYTVGAIDGIYMQNLATGATGVSAPELDAISSAIVGIIDSIHSPR
ncbi:TetR family transcriptional regulator [Rhodococcus sp. G-MC3]|uniref:TetR/AcrR family transcriptional regulator n=1 Tax=Rhodococcus sp. G-MC3 TaxID=3046209 RepID=UPI0024BBC0E8|nr:TetR family transcriptional regulator [Rhodococcus sp. G-MC3]MDJ0392395.1 TetR family transcriptional regulator [Rhodococcus sp. G-MC3]